MQKCFGIGLNKTGTKTLGAALKTLGYRTVSCRHDLMERFGQGEIAPAIAAAQDFDGFEDWPWPLIYRELDAAFPDSKFVLTCRADATAWFASLTRHARRTGPTLARRIAYGHADPWENEAHHLRLYERHLAEVAAHFRDRPEQLQIVSWERGDGWNELCRFLGYAVPDKPFPHENRSPD